MASIQEVRDRFLADLQKSVRILDEDAMILALHRVELADAILSVMDLPAAV
jgi:hypothetical protein